MKSKNEEAIYVTKIEKGVIRAVLIGITPLVENRQSEKTKHELLFPKGRKSSAEKAGSMKHDPYAEFRSSPHTLSDIKAPTFLAMPAAAPKRALASAALDMPGAKKAQIGRLAWVPGEYLPVYGTPEIFLAPVRNSDMNRTPDIRSRAILRQWMMPVTVEYASPILNPTVLINLLNAAGLYIGIGDGRNEKGCLNFGQFEVLSESQAAKDERCIKLLKQDRSVQIAAMKAPGYYDEQTKELMEWFTAEVKVRGKSLSQSSVAAD